MTTILFITNDNIDEAGVVQRETRQLNHLLQIIYPQRTTDALLIGQLDKYTYRKPNIKENNLKHDGRKSGK